jgi:hypothetical protein
MKLPGRLTVGIQLAGVGVLGWLYGGDLLEYRRALGADVSAMTELPSAGMAIGACLAGAAALGAAGWGVLRTKPDGFRGYRLMPIAVVVLLFVDLFVLGAARGPNIPSADRLAAAMDHFADEARQRSRPGAVLADSQALDGLLADLGPPPYLSRGVRVPRYALVLRQGCEGPVTASSGAPVGTVFYCISSSGDRAWVTAVALPAGERFGAPAVLSGDGAPRGWLIQVVEGDNPAVEVPSSGL